MILCKVSLPNSRTSTHKLTSAPCVGRNKEAREIHQSLLMTVTDLLGTFMLWLGTESSSMLFSVGLFMHLITDQVLLTKALCSLLAEPDVTNLSLRVQPIKEAGARIALSNFQPWFQDSSFF